MNKKLVEYVFPQCLLWGCITLQDCLNVIHWWLSLDKEAMNNHKERFIDIFKHPLVSSELNALRTSARGAARAEADGVACYDP
jgi:hypothetical protein